MWFYGHPDDIVTFPNAPDNNLTTFSGNFVDYVKVYLWALYFYEHFGGQAMLLNLVSQPANSVTGVQAALTALGYTTTFGQMVADWTTANYLDNPDIEGGKYNYAGATLPPFASITKSTYPVPVTSASVNHYAADYVKFTNGQPQQLTFNGGDTADWTARVVKYQAGVPQSVEAIALNGTDDGTANLYDFGTGYDQVVLVISNISGSGLMSYQYSTTAIPTSVDEPASLAGGLRLQATGPNPFRGETALHLSGSRAGVTSATVHDVGGSLVRVLEAGPSADGGQDLRWDGRDGSGQPVPAGAYFVKVATADGQRASRQLTVLR
jgi:hypothetical protein